jgi:hypothetical protein
MRPGCPTCAGGGIGRRARLRALWDVSPVEVRVLFGALRKAPHLGLSYCLRSAGRQVHHDDGVAAAREPRAISRPIPPVTIATAYVDVLVSMGADGFADRARHELLATGAKVRKRIDDTRDELTPQEGLIARLARDGRTNSQLSAELYISPRTVEARDQLAPDPPRRPSGRDREATPA